MKFYKNIVFILLLFSAIHIYAQNSLDVLGLGISTPAVAAYSLRKVSSSYSGHAIQVRRSLDNATLNIGFDGSGNLDSAALLAFISINNGYVSIWYDQSGYGRNLINTNNNQQPQIVFNGTFKYIGSRIALDFGGNKGLVFSGSLNIASVTSVIKSESINWPGFHAILDGTPRIGGLLDENGSTFHSNVFPLAIWRNGISKLFSDSLGPTNDAAVLSFSTQTDNLSKIFVGNYDGGSVGGSILQCEAIGFSTVSTVAIRQLLECNQASYFGISSPLCITSILGNPSSLNRFECRGKLANPLAVDVSGVGLSFQWYSNTVSSVVGGTLIAGATLSTFTPPTTVTGTTYYYVVVTGLLGVSVTSGVSGAIIVEDLPTVSISPSSVTINAGDAITLTANGASSYSWSATLSKPLDYVSTSRLAVGLRLLRSAYAGPAVRLRRESDNVESDFGFSGNDLNTEAIEAWLSGSSGFCVLLYDQSGNGNNMVAPSVGAQPLYVSNGLNGKPIFRFTTAQSIHNSFNFTTPYTVTYAAKQTGPSRGRVLNASNNWLLGWYGGSKGQAFFDGWVSQPGGIPADNDAYVYTAIGTGVTSFIFENGIPKTVSQNGGISGPNGLRINENEPSDVDVADIFAFDSVFSALDRLKVEKSTASYYGIYADLPLGITAGITLSPPETTTYAVTGISANGGCAETNYVTISVLQNPNLTNFSDIVKTYFDGSYTITPPSSLSPGVLLYSSSNLTVATISGSTVTIIGPGTSTITATQIASAEYFGSSITYTLTVNEVTVLTRNGKISTSDSNYINNSGTLNSSSTLNPFGKIISTKSNDGLSAGSAGASALQIKRDYPSAIDGLYWIKNSNINGGTPFQIYADMTTDGGGWTLILCNNNNSGWNGTNAILRNETIPTINGQYSIIAYADYLKKSSSGFQYMMEATSRGRWGGIWTANQAYSFVNTNNTQTDITLDTKFDSWSYQGSGIEQIMPWYSPGSCGAITTSSDPNGDWWGTLVSACGWSPVPWMASWNQQPGIIWYWVR